MFFGFQAYLVTGKLQIKPESDFCNRENKHFAFLKTIF